MNVSARNPTLHLLRRWPCDCGQRERPSIL